MFKMKCKNEMKSMHAREFLRIMRDEQCEVNENINRNESKYRDKIKLPSHRVVMSKIVDFLLLFFLRPTFSDLFIKPFKVTLSFCHKACIQ